MTAISCHACGIAVYPHLISCPHCGTRMLDKKGKSPCFLSAQDFPLIEAYVSLELGPQHPLRGALLTKIERASVMPSERMPSNIVTLGTRVRYRAGTMKPESRTLTGPQARVVPGAHVPLLSPAGIALLGQRPGDMMILPGGGTLTLLSIEFQPEAAQRIGRRAGTAMKGATL